MLLKLSRLKDKVNNIVLSETQIKSDQVDLFEFGRIYNTYDFCNDNCRFGRCYIDGDITVIESLFSFSEHQSMVAKCWYH